MPCEVGDYTDFYVGIHHATAVGKLFRPDNPLLPNSPEMGRDENTPGWVQHMAFEVDSMETLLAAKAKLEANGVEVLGPTNHTIFKSIYFFDPNGHRLELAANTGTPEMMSKLDEVKWDMINVWSQTKRAPKHAAWMHDGSM